VKATHYNYFRDFDPAVGRYIQSDPIGLGGGLSTYGYVLQNPLALSDPLGLEACAGTWIRQQEVVPRGGRLVLPRCTCYWLCVPCEGSVAWSGNPLNLPQTSGWTIVTYNSAGDNLSVGTGGGAGRATTNRGNGPPQPPRPGDPRPIGGGGGRGGGGGAAGGGYNCICPKPGADGCLSCPVPR